MPAWLACAAGLTQHPLMLKESTPRPPVALVTGASSGIGRATALALARAGYRLVLAGRNEERLREVLFGCEACGASVETWLGNVADAAACDDLAAIAASRYGRLDLLVNNAGIIHRASVDETSDAQWHETLSVNLSSVFFLSRAAIPLMRTQGTGCIVNVASDWGLVGGERAAAYCASKGAVVQLTRAMALDHSREGIRVNAVCPGDVDTPMLDREAAQRGVDPVAARVRAADEIPDGRLATPEDVAETILFLASPGARHIVGAAIPVDGGATAR